MLNKSTKKERLLLSLLLWSIGLAPFLRVITSPRFFYPTPLISFEIGNFIERFLIVLALLLSFIIIVSNINRVPKKGIAIWLSLFLFTLMPIISAKLGYAEESLVNFFTVIPFLFTGIFFITPLVDKNWLINQIKKIILFYAFGSLISAILLPKWAIETNYTQGLIPGFDFRLHGIIGHANNLSPLLLSYVLLDILLPNKKITGKISKIIVLFCLVLTQSKTAWVTLILLYLIKIFYRFLLMKSREKLLFFSFIAFISAVLIIFLAFIYDDIAQFITSNQNISTLTGRIQIWSITLGLWKLNPLFGYSPSLWNESMGLRYEPILHWKVPHAHNQVIQTLGETGIIGLMALIIYLLILVFFAVKNSFKSKGVTLIFVLILLIRSITEPVFREIFNDGNFFFHVIIFIVFLIFANFDSATIQPKKEV